MGPVSQNIGRHNGGNTIGAYGAYVAPPDWPPFNGLVEAVLAALDAKKAAEQPVRQFIVRPGSTLPPAQPAPTAQPQERLPAWFREEIILRRHEMRLVQRVVGNLTKKTAGGEKRLLARGEKVKDDMIALARVRLAQIRRDHHNDVN